MPRRTADADEATRRRVATRWLELRAGQVKSFGCMTANQYAAEVGVSPGTLRKWVRELGGPGDPGGSSVS